MTVNKEGRLDNGGCLLPVSEWGLDHATKLKHVSWHVNIVINMVSVILGSSYLMFVNMLVFSDHFGFNQLRYRNGLRRHD